MREVCKTTFQLHSVLFNWVHMLYGVESDVYLRSTLDLTLWISAPCPPIAAQSAHLP